MKVFGALSFAYFWKFSDWKYIDLNKRNRELFGG